MRWYRLLLVAIAANLAAVLSIAIEGIAFRWTPVMVLLASLGVITFLFGIVILLSNGDQRQHRPTSVQDGNVDARLEKEWINRIRALRCLSNSSSWYDQGLRESHSGRWGRSWVAFIEAMKALPDQDDAFCSLFKSWETAIVQTGNGDSLSQEVQLAWEARLLSNTSHVAEKCGEELQLPLNERIINDIETVLQNVSEACRRAEETMAGAFPGWLRAPRALKILRSARGYPAADRLADWAIQRVVIILSVIPAVTLVSGVIWFAANVSDEPEPQLPVVFMLRFDGEEVPSRDCIRVDAKNIYLIEVESQSAIGESVPVSELEFRWHFDPPDSRNQPSDFSRANAIVYTAPDELLSQAVTVDVIAPDAKQYSKTLCFDITATSSALPE